MTLPAPASRQLDLIGAALGSYEVSHRVGPRTWLGRDAHGGAVEIDAERARGTEELEERLGRLRALAHPGIADALAVGVDRDREIAYLVRRPIVGQSLLDRGRNHQRLDAEAAVSAVEQVLRALAYAHRCGVPHAALDPSSVVLDQDGTATLRGFALVPEDGSLERHQRADVRAAARLLSECLGKNEGSSGLVVRDAEEDGLSLALRSIAASSEEPTWRWHEPEDLERALEGFRERLGESAAEAAGKQKAPLATVLAAVVLVALCFVAVAGIVRVLAADSRGQEGRVAADSGSPKRSSEEPAAAAAPSREQDRRERELSPRGGVGGEREPSPDPAARSPREARPAGERSAPVAPRLASAPSTSGRSISSPRRSPARLEAPGPRDFETAAETEDLDADHSEGEDSRVSPPEAQGHSVDTVLAARPESPATLEWIYRHRPAWGHLTLKIDGRVAWSSPLPRGTDDKQGPETIALSGELEVTPGRHEIEAHLVLTGRPRREIVRRLSADFEPGGDLGLVLELGERKRHLAAAWRGNASRRSADGRLASRP